MTRQGTHPGAGTARTRAGNFLGAAFLAWGGDRGGVRSVPRKQHFLCLPWGRKGPQP